MLFYRYAVFIAFYAVSFSFYEVLILLCVVVNVLRAVLSSFGAFLLVYAVPFSLCVVVNSLYAVLLSWGALPLYAVPFSLSSRSLVVV